MLPMPAEAAAGERGDEHQRERADREGDGRGLQAADLFAEARVDRRLQADEATGGDREQDRQTTAHFASSQFSPTPMSTASGGSCSHTPHISRSISSRAAGASAGRSFEQQLVVDREDQARLQLGRGERPLAADHRELDDVRRGALDHGVDRQALAERAHLVVAGAQLRDLPAPAPERRDVALLLGLLDRLRDEPRHLRESARGRRR